MKLYAAIKKLKALKIIIQTPLWDKERREEINEAVDTVLAEFENLEDRYYKGYQDGFKQAKFDCEMDKLDGR